MVQNWSQWRTTIERELRAIGPRNMPPSFKLFFLILSVVVLLLLFYSGDGISNPLPSFKAFSFSSNSRDPTEGFHNTLLVDHLLINYTEKEITPSSKELKLKFLQLEEAYQSLMRKREERIQKDGQKLSILDYFPAAFQCPHLKEKVGPFGRDGAWICGLELFDNEPRPKECVIYIYGESDLSIQSEFLQRTECHIFLFGAKSVSKDERIHVNKLEANKPLSTILRQNDHGWIDIFVMKINGPEFNVLSQVMGDLEVLPFAQLHVEISLPTEKTEQNWKKYFDWFVRLERSRLRPFQSEIFSNNKVQYSFINIRGKHLLLVGK